MCASEQTAFADATILVTCRPSSPPIRSGTSELINRDAVAVNKKEQIMSIGSILLIVVILILIGVPPIWPHTRSWGYGPVESPVSSWWLGSSPRWH